MTQLEQIRNELLNLHKVLLDYQKVQYEKAHGQIANPNAYYQLVVNDSAFAWLRILSALVVSIDEVLEGKEIVTEEKIGQIALYTKKLLSGAGIDEAFAKQYNEAVHADPTVAGHHAAVMALL